MIKVDEIGVKLYSTKEVAQFLHVSTPTIRGYMNKGLFGVIIPVGSQKYIKRQGLEDYLHGVPFEKTNDVDSEKGGIKENDDSVKKENGGKRKKKRLLRSKSSA